MWFKNLIVYRLTTPWALGSAELEEQLTCRPLMACNGFEMQTRGWVAVANDGRLLHTQNQQHLLALGVNQKLLPASIINQVAKERAAEVAAEQGFPVGRRQMRELKERVADELRGRALTKRSVLHAWLDAEHGWLIVDTPSTARAEELIATLRDTLGSLSVTLLETERSPAVSMGAWLMFGEVPGRFHIEQDLELKSIKDPRSMIRYVQHPLESREVQKQIAAGKSVARLGMSWNDRVSFLLNDRLEIKRVQFLDVARDRDDGTAEDADEKFAIDFALMTGELGQLLKELIDLLGGEARQEADLAAA
jgi:recombination associated protein RdgC